MFITISVIESSMFEEGIGEKGKINARSNIVKKRAFRKSKDSTLQ